MACERSAWLLKPRAVLTRERQGATAGFTQTPNSPHLPSHPLDTPMKPCPGKEKRKDVLKSLRLSFSSQHCREETVKMAPPPQLPTPCPPTLTSLMLYQERMETQRFPCNPNRSASTNPVSLSPANFAWEWTHHHHSPQTSARGLTPCKPTPFCNYL